MDFVKKAADSLKGSQGGSTQQAPVNQQQKPDYVDKAFGTGAKKAGFNVDPSMAERITDGGREAFEKATGKHVPSKISN